METIERNAHVEPTLTDFDIILVNTSGGKDSQTMLRKLARLAAAAGVTDRVVVVHADLGRVEWAGTKDLARRGPPSGRALRAAFRAGGPAAR